jgi:hypothetical protein
MRFASRFHCGRLYLLPVGRIIGGEPDQGGPDVQRLKKFGFEIEGTRRADAFRAGKFVDSLMMARVRLD